MKNRRSIQFSRLRRLRFGVVIGIGIALVILGIWAGGLFSVFRLRLNNVRYSELPTQGNVVIVAIDDPSLEEYGRFNSWSRTLYGDLVTQLADGGAKVVAFDVLFADPSANPEDDEAFSEAINQARRSRNRTRVVMSIAGDREIRADDDYKIQFVNFVRPILVLSEYTRNYGFVNITPDQDGTLRWQPLLAQETGSSEYEVPLSVAAYLTFFNIPYEQLAEEQLLKQEGDMLFLKNMDIPIDKQGRTLINYFGRPESDNSFVVYSFNNVINGNVPDGAFENKVVLVGAINATGLTDNYTVPLGLDDKTMSGVAIHANMVEMLFQEWFLTAQDETSQAGLIIVFSLLTSVILTQLRWRFILVCVPLFMILWFIGAIAFGNINSVVMNIFDPLLAIIFPLPAALTLNTYLETQRREWAELLLDSAMTTSGQQLKRDEILETVTRDTQRIIESKQVEVWLWDEIAERLERAYPPVAEGDTAEYISREVLRLAMHALKIRDIVDTRNHVIVPLVWQGNELGVIIAVQPPKLNNQRRQMLNLFAWQTASVLANVDLYQEMRDLSELKTRMIRMASHDLKSPIGGVLGFADLLIEDQQEMNFLDEDQADYLNRIMEGAENMERIVNDILSMERFRSGTSSFAAYDLLVLTQQVVSRYQREVKDKTQELNTQFPTDFIGMYGDKEQLHEAISNIVGNAIKYTPDGGKIQVELTRQNDYALITVKDNGPGIPKQAQDRLFQEFYRVKTEATEHISGTGLGLSLVRSVINAHKGKVWVESDTGQGATFFIQLPIPAKMGVDLTKLAAKSQEQPVGGTEKST